MSKNISLNEIKKFWPEKAPDINIVQKYVKKYEKEKIVIKYGGNVLIDRNVFNNFISCLLYTSPSPRDRTRSRMPSSA